MAVLASFTGLRIASGLRALAPPARKREIAKAAIALGGGIWAMHFIAMLSMRISHELTYAALPTLGSVLVAILITGVALLILHGSERTTRKIGLAGVLMGLGIVSMHYLGMAAIGGKTVTYEIAGFFVSSGVQGVALIIVGEDHGDGASVIQEQEFAHPRRRSARNTA
ncbi:MAG: hypothetical protein IMF05_05170 [Proteobacteria bacterium]|nr:hypothetical protein [Pseudomonadota bacterium]